MNKTGILDRAVNEMPIAVIDFETTGLNPGSDRVVEACVVRIEPGQPHAANLLQCQRPPGLPELTVSWYDGSTACAVTRARPSQNESQKTNTRRTGNGNRYGVPRLFLRGRLSAKV